MTNWTSQGEITRDEEVFVILMNCLLGVFFIEVVAGIEYDLGLFCRRRPFGLPQVRIAVAINTTIKINCQTLFLVNQITGNLAIGLASLTFALRTAVWQSAYVSIFISILMVGQWFLLLHGILIKAEWMPTVGCVIKHVNNKILAAAFIYTMVFDLIVTCLLAGRVWYSPRVSMRYPVTAMLFKDGLIYLFVTFLANLAATTFMLLNLNSIMSVILNAPAAVVSTVMASHMMRRLARLGDEEEEFVAGSESVPTFDTSPSVVRQRNARDRIVQIELNEVVDTAPAPVQAFTPSFELQNNAITQDMETSRALRWKAVQSPV
ncbi:hypothetical protein BD410DRAFT_808707 [Rickenella mellea]|uniref:Uncharacterized protein n=1 Tax=Rickenella mellea TaxID=50990 RepID=A0A4Y7PMM8_9AGAM|nr:hypothetical protein BD410DRAFT_808707 [Rickenella mellea]